MVKIHEKWGKCRQTKKMYSCMRSEENTEETKKMQKKRGKCMITLRKCMISLWKYSEKQG